MTRLRLPRFAIGLLALLVLPTAALAQCVSLTTTGSAVTQNFDTLSNTAGSTTNMLTITGWFLTESGGGARDNEQYAVDTGGSNTGDVYSYGSAANTNRALGALQSGTLIPIFGACFTNNTGTTLGSLDVAYVGEQWRLGTVSRTDRIDFQYSLNATDLLTGVWTDVDALDFITPFTTTVGARDGDVDPNRTALSTSIPALSIANGATFWIRWTDLNASGADDGLAVDDFALTPQGAGAPISTLAINDVTLAEGSSAGTTTFTFTVSVTPPLATGNISFDIATTDGTAQDGVPVGEDNDYVARALTGQVIPAGNPSYSFDVTVNHDNNIEPNETFFVNLSNIVATGPAVPNVGDAQGQGTISNDDVALVPIHDIQGPGASSPLSGSVTTRGIVTGVRANGFFMQEPDASVDADPMTSEGIFVFTSAVPPAQAALGNLVQVTATITEFVPAQDPLQPPLTELTVPTVSLLSSGNPLPTAVPLTAGFPSPAGLHDQLERLEGMRVAIASLTVGAPTTGSINEANATATSNGVFQGVVTGNARAFREAGIQAPDPAPAGSSIPPIPRFDSNPEVLRVDSDGLVGMPQINVHTGAVVTGLVGPLDYGFRRYTLLPETPPVVVPGVVPTAVTIPLAGEVTIASYNLQRFFDTVNDPAIGEPVLTSGAFAARLGKASLGIRDFLRTPDIVGVIEVENLSTLQALAMRISADALAASQPDPLYQAFLVEGNDVGGIDVGFLVKTALVAPMNTPRVVVNSVVQELDGTLFVNPDASTETLNDRPPLRLDAAVTNGTGQSWPVTVIVNHLRSLNGVNDETAGSNGWPTEGARVRAKRQQQAVDLANLVQARQTATPTENIVLVGDFNAFEVNDGLADLMNVIAGTPTPDNQTAVPGDGADLVSPDLLNLSTSEPAPERYSYVFDGNAQSLDHILINGSVATSTTTQRIDHARINADFAETERNLTSVQRLSDHDPLLLYVSPAGFQNTDVSITVSDTPDPVNAGTALVYTVGVSNLTATAASTVNWSTTLTAGTSFQSLAAPGGWSCTTPPVGSGGTVSCAIASLTGMAVANFTLSVNTSSSLAAGATLSLVSVVTTVTPENGTANNSATATTTVATLADLSIQLVDSADPVIAGGPGYSYTVTLANSGPSDAAAVGWAGTLPTGTTFVSLGAASGFSCTTPAVGATGSVSCTAATLASAGSAGFTLTVVVSPAVLDGTVLSFTTTANSTTADGVPGNNSDTETTTVSATADLTAALTVLPSVVPLGGTLTATAGLTNGGPGPAIDAVLIIVLPAGLQLQTTTPDGGGVCLTSGGLGVTVTCTWSGSTAAGITRSVVLGLRATGALGAPISVTADALTADPVTANNSANVTVVVTADAVPIPASTPLGLLVLMGLMMGVGGLSLRRRG